MDAIIKDVWLQYGALGLLLGGMGVVIYTLWRDLRETRNAKDAQAQMILTVVVENTRAINDLTNKLTKR